MSGSTSRCRSSAASTARPSNPKWMRDAGLSFSLTTHGLEDPDDFPKRVREAMARGLSADDALAAVTTIPARQLGLAARLGTIEAGKIADLAVETGDPFGEGTRVSEIWIDGRRFELPTASGKPAAAAEKSAPLPADVRPLPARDDGPLAQPSAVVVRNATIWTEGPQGTLRGRRPRRVGRQDRGRRQEPRGARRRASRSTRTASTSARASSTPTRTRRSTAAVNECTHTVTAEVRIRDVLDPFDVAIYRELAGGTTVAQRAARLGQRDRRAEPDHEVAARRRSGRPALRRRSGGIKFALGENPKQSNFQNPHPRYPATRMGVANLIRERFLAARDYRRAAGGVREGRVGEGRAPVRRRRPAARGARRGPRGQAPDPLPLLPQGRDPHDDPRRGRVRRQGRDVPARARGLQGRRRDREARRRRLDLLRLVGLQVRGVRRDPVQRRAHAGARRGRVVQLRFGRARAPPEQRGGEGRQVRRRAAGRGARVRDDQPGEAARRRQARRLARARQGRRLRDLERRPALGRERSRRRPGSRAGSTSTARRTSRRAPRSRRSAQISWRRRRRSCPRPRETRARCASRSRPRRSRTWRRRAPRRRRCRAPGAAHEDARIAPRR